MGKTCLSFTAWVVIASHLAMDASSRWHALVKKSDLPFFRHCDAYFRQHLALCGLLGRLPEKAKLKLVEKIVALGAPQHFALRKQAIARQLEEAIAANARQLVVLGAGLDTLALKTATGHSGMECIELDMPGMHEHKMALLRGHYGKLPDNFHGVGADLSKATLLETLLACPYFDRGKETFFVLEGVTMYLNERQVSALFDDVRSACAASSIIFTAIERCDRKTDSFVGGLRDRILSRREENFRWGLPQQAMAGFLKGRGFTQRYLTAYHELQRGWRTENEMEALRRQPGEYLVYAARADHPQPTG